MFNPGQSLLSSNFGAIPAGLGFPIYVSSNPALANLTQGASGTLQIGQVAVWPNNGVWQLIGYTSPLGVLTANWVELSNSTGNVLSVTGTTNQITATNTGGNVVLSFPSPMFAPGSFGSTTSLSAGTSLTVSNGNANLTNGNVVLGTAGNKIIIATGTNASAGTSGNMSGSPGAVTVATTASSATAKIFYSRAATGGTPGQVSITAQDGTGFTLTSTGNETSTFNWWIINA